MVFGLVHCCVGGFLVSCYLMVGVCCYGCLFYCSLMLIIRRLLVLGYSYCVFFVLFCGLLHTVVSLCFLVVCRL